MTALSYEQTKAVEKARRLFNEISAEHGENFVRKLFKTMGTRPKRGRPKGRAPHKYQPTQEKDTLRKRRERNPEYFTKLDLLKRPKSDFPDLD
jgi:hypothetical protein